MNYNRHALRGYHKGQFLRSYNEFLFALYLEYLNNSTYIVEPFKLVSTNPNISKTKIPDFLVTTKIGKTFLVEIKGDAKQTEECIVEYAINKYDTRGYDIRFMTINRRAMIKKLKSHLGETLFNSIDTEYHSQRLEKFYPGFPGELNPMFNKRHSEKTRQKIKKAKIGQNSGENNPMFNRHHTEEAKYKCGVKWRDEETARNMVRKGLETNIKSMSPKIKEIFLKYAYEALILGLTVKKPLEINNYNSITEKKMQKYFNSSAKEYYSFLENATCQE